MEKGQRDSEQQVFEKHCSSPFFYSSILHHHIQYKIQYSIRFQSLAILKSPKRQEAKSFITLIVNVTDFQSKTAFFFWQFILFYKDMSESAHVSAPILTSSTIWNLTFLLSHVGLSLNFWRLGCLSRKYFAMFLSWSTWFVSCQKFLLLLPQSSFFTQ